MGTRIPIASNLTPGSIVIGVLAALVAGSLARLVSLRGRPDELVRERQGSLKTWWVIVPSFGAVVYLGQIAAAIAFVLMGELALREFARLIPVAARDRVLKRLAQVAVPVHYALICLGWTEAALVFIPLGMLIVFSLSQTLTGRTEGFTSAVAVWYWGLVLLVYGPSHAVLLWSLPEDQLPAGGAAGWFVYLMILTEINDIAQAFFGRHLGKRHLVPVVSPHKTWAGFFGGVLTTVALAVLMAPVVTPFAVTAGTAETGYRLSVSGVTAAVTAGLLIAVTGFLGDLNLSGLKRDAGVKDSGTMLPGQGGLLDRFDSLTFTAPAFYVFVLWNTA